MKTNLKHVNIDFYSGGRVYSTRNDILEYDRETKKWIKISTMMAKRWAPAVSVVDFNDYTDGQGHGPLRFCRG